MSAVSISPQGFTNEEKKHHVLTYAMLPQGHKGPYRDEHGVSRSQLRTWQRAMADGDLERGAVPRHTGSMTFEDAAEIKRLRAEVEHLKNRCATAEGDADRMRAAADALGKAISVMQQRGAAFGADEPTSKEDS